MATVYMNGFEWNSYYENILSWSGATLTNSYPLSGDYCMYVTDSNYFRWTTDAVGDFYIQLGLKFTNSGTQDGNILKWYAGTTILGMLSFNPIDQKVSVFKGNRTSNLGTSSQQLLYNQWYYIEMRIVLDPSSGSVQLKIDGETQFTFSGSTTPDSTSSTLFYMCSEVVGSGSSTHYYVDDIVINDTTGSYNNTWPNGAKIVLLFPTGRGNSTQWDKVAHLDNYENVDKYPTLDPEDYLLTNLNSRLDLYLNNNLPVDAFSVGAVRVDAWALKNSGSDIMLNLALRVGSTNFISIDNELGVSYSLKQWLHQLNPGTCIGWTVSDVNDLESGMRSNIPE
jgi:hypothetical protein